MDQGLLDVARRYAKRFSAHLDDRPGDDRADADADEDAAGRGYEDLGEVVRDLVALVDVVWVSGTRRFFVSLPP